MAASVLAAVTLTATTVIYSHTLAEAGLRHTIASVGESPLHVRIAVNDRPLGGADYQRLRDVVESAVARRIEWLADHQHRYGRSQSLLTAKDKAGVLEVQGERAFLSFLTGFRQKARLTEGRWPQWPVPAERADGLTLEALVGTRTASRMHWEVGSTLLLLPYGAQYKERLYVHLVGLVEPEDPGDVYWLGDLSNFDLMEEGETVMVPFFLEEESFFNGLGATYPWLLGSYWWRVFLNVDSVTTPLVDRTLQGLEATERDINKVLPRSLMLTGLDSTLEGFKSSLQLAQVPLFLFASLVVGVLLYFLALVLDLMVRDRAREMTVLRGRGASALQAVALLTAGEGLALVIGAIGLGLFLGWAIVRSFLVRGLEPAGVEDVASLVTLTLEAYILAGVVGAAAFALFFLSGLRAARLHLADFLKERARPPGVPLVHRYYLDVLVLLMMGVLLWQVRTRGGFVSERLAGGLQVDPTLLVGPAVALLAAGLVLLRALPALLKALSWLSDRVLPAWASFALKGMARDPVAHGLLAVMVMASAALGAFAASFAPTLSQSQRDQVFYSTIGDIVVREPSGGGGDWELAQRLQVVPGVRALTAAHRESARLAAKGSEPPVTVLAVTPETLGETVWFRPDFSEEGLPQLSERIRRVPTRQGAELTLPSEAESLGLWIRLKQRETVYAWPANLWARVVDSQGRYSEVLLEGPHPTEKWQYLEAALPELGPYTHPPFRLVSIYLGTTPLGGQTSGTIYLDDITVKGPGLPSEGAAVEDFEEERPWSPLPALEEQDSTIQRKAEAAHSGKAGLEFSWRRRPHDTPTGVILSKAPPRLPALGGPTFSRGQEVVVHRGGCLVPVTVEGVVRYFPSLDAYDEPFLLLNLEDYDMYLREQPGCTGVGPTEYWLSHHADATPTEVLDAVRRQVSRRMEVQDRASLLSSTLRDPLRSSSKGVTLLGIVVLAGVVLLGLGAYGTAFVQRVRVDLAVVRTFGFLRRHLVLGLLVERILVVVLGGTAGWAIGVALSRWALGYLAVTPAGDPVLPPMVAVVDGGLLAAALGSIVGAVAAALLLGAVQVLSLDMAESLRQEE